MFAVKLFKSSRPGKHPWRVGVINKKNWKQKPMAMKTKSFTVFVE